MKTRSRRKPDYTLDFRKVISSMALLELSRIFDKMEANQMLEIHVQNKDTIADIFKVLPKTSYEMTISEIESSVNLIRVKKIKQKKIVT